MAKTLKVKSGERSRKAFAEGRRHSAALALFVMLLCFICPLSLRAQVVDDPFRLDERLLRPITIDTDTLHAKEAKELLAPEFAPISADTAALANKQRDWSTWRPDVKRAMWLALVFPGAGQIYNRKYWKLPIIYGGFVGCIYAYSWNNQMYKDYAQAYQDMMDDDPATKSYEQMHLGSQINEGNMARYQKLFKQRKDRFRRYRDLSTFCIIGVYALSVIDAYVDASLSEFDISNDLSLRISPAYIHEKRNNLSPYANSGWGLQCSINF